MTTNFVAAGIAIIAAAALVAVLLLRRKNREIWQKLWELEAEGNRNREALVAVRKAQCLATMADLRLPPHMPSQHGEDLILWEFFGGRRHGFFVEVGAYNGVSFSNTYLLEAVGWGGILVEANPERFEECVKARPYSRCVQAAIVGEGGRKHISLTVPIGDGGNRHACFHRSERATSPTRCPRDDRDARD